MLGDVELNYNEEQCILLQINKIAYILLRLYNSESYVIMYWLVHTTDLFGKIHRWMFPCQNIKEHLNI